MESEASASHGTAGTNCPDVPGESGGGGCSIQLLSPWLLPCKPPMQLGSEPSPTRGNPLNRALGWDKPPVLEKAGWLPAGRNTGRS